MIASHDTHTPARIVGRKVHAESSRSLLAAAAASLAAFSRSARSFWSEYSCSKRAALSASVAADDDEEEAEDDDGQIREYKKEEKVRTTAKTRE